MNLPLSAHRSSSGTKLSDDPIVSDVRQVRERYLKSFNYDLRALFDDLKQQESLSDKTFTSYPARTVLPVELTE